MVLLMVLVQGRCPGARGLRAQVLEPRPVSLVPQHVAVADGKAHVTPGAGVVEQHRAQRRVEACSGQCWPIRSMACRAEEYCAGWSSSIRSQYRDRPPVGVHEPSPASSPCGPACRSSGRPVVLVRPGRPGRARLPPGPRRTAARRCCSRAPPPSPRGPAHGRRSAAPGCRPCRGSPPSPHRAAVLLVAEEHPHRLVGGGLVVAGQFGVLLDRPDPGRHVTPVGARPARSAGWSQHLVAHLLRHRRHPSGR
jgi:hypothetical protein